MGGFDVSVYLGLVTCILLAGVAGLLVLVAQQVRALRREAGKLPLLQDDMSRLLLTARQGVDELKTKLGAMGPQLDKQLGEASKHLTELEMMVARAEKMAAKLEQLQATAPAPAAVASPAASDNTSPSSPEVVTANGHAAKEPGEQVNPDPLEDLLAGLREARVGVARALAQQSGGQAALFESAEIVPLREPAKQRVVSRSEEALRAKMRKKAG